MSDLYVGLVQNWISTRKTCTLQNGHEELTGALHPLTMELVVQSWLNFTPQTSHETFCVPRWSISHFPPERTMVNVLLHWCCVTQINVRSNTWVPIFWKRLYSLTRYAVQPVLARGLDSIACLIVRVALKGFQYYPKNRTQTFVPRCTPTSQNIIVKVSVATVGIWLSAFLSQSLILR